VLQDLSRSEANPSSIPRNPYRHHIYMDNSVYERWSIRDLIHNHSIRRHIPYYNEILSLTRTLWRKTLLDSFQSWKVIFIWTRFFIIKKNKTWYTQTFFVRLDIRKTRGLLATRATTSWRGRLDDSNDIA